jgi:hypothetical protein
MFNFTLLTLYNHTDEFDINEFDINEFIIDHDLSLRFFFTGLTLLFFYIREYNIRCELQVGIVKDCIIQRFLEIAFITFYIPIEIGFTILLTKNLGLIYAEHLADKKYASENGEDWFKKLKYEPPIPNEKV